MFEYFIPKIELPKDLLEIIEKENAETDELIKKKDWASLEAKEEVFLNAWFMWKQRTDIVSGQEQDNTELQLMEAILNLTLYNEVLLYLRNNYEDSQLAQKGRETLERLRNL